MGQYDGSIVIGTSIDEDGFVSGSKDVVEACRRVAATIEGITEKQRIALEKQINSFSKMNDAYSQQEEKVKALGARLAELNGQKVETEAYQTVNAEIEKLAVGIQKANAKRKELLATGGSETSKSFQKLEYQIERLEGQMERAIERKKELESSGGAYQKADSSQVEADLERAKNKLSQMGDSLNTSYKGLKQKFVELAGDTGQVSAAASEASTAVKGLASRLGGTLRKGLSGISSLAKNAAAGLSSIGKGSKSANAGLNGGLKAVIRYGIGVESLFALLNKLRRALVEGMGNLAKYSDQANASISGMTAAVTRLKNSVAAVFAPVLNVVAPVVTRLIHLLSTGISYIGAFFAALSGQKTYTRAIAVQEDYAASLDGSASAAKNAAKETKGYLSGLDEIHKFDDGVNAGAADGGSAGGMDTGVMFEEAEIPNAASGVADKVKKIFSGIWDVFKTAWQNKGAKVIDAAKTAWNSVKGAVQDVGTTVYDVFTSNIGLAWVESLMERLRSVLGVIASVATAFSDAWNSGAGEEHVGALFGMLTNVNSLIVTIRDSFSRVFSSGVGVAIWSNILGIITGVYNTVGNLARQVQIAWDTAGLGDSIWAGILGIVNTILGTVHSIVDSTAAWAETLDITPLLESVNALLTAIEPLTQNIGAGLEWFWNNVLLPIAGWVITDAVPVFLNLLADGVSTLNAVIDVFKPLAVWLWDRFLQPFGEWAGGVIITALGKINGLFSVLGGWIKEHQDALRKFIAIAAPVAAGFLAIQAALFLYANAATIATAVSTVFGAVMAVLTSPVSLVVAAIAALAAGFVYLYEHAEPFRNFIDGIIEGAKELIPGIIEGIKAGWNAFKEWLSGLFGGIVDWFREKLGIHSPSTVMAEMGEFLVDGLLNGIKETWGNITEFFGDVLGNLKETLSGAWSSIKDKAATAWDGVKSTILGAWDQIKTATSDAGAKIGEKASSAWANVKNLVSSNLNNAKNTAASAWDGMKDKVSSAASRISDTVSAKFSGVSSIVGNKLSDVKSTVSSGFDAVKSNITDKMQSAMSMLQNQSWSSVGSNICNGISSGINSGWQWLKGTVSNLASNLLSSAKNALGIHSPSRLFRDQVGDMIPAGIGEGIEDSEGGLLNTVKTVAGSLADGFGSSLSNLHFKIPEVTGSLLPNVSLPTPVLATGTVIPPRAAYSDNDAQELKDTLSGLGGLVQRLTGSGPQQSGQNNQYRIILQVDGRTLYDTVMNQADLVRSQSGRNPFGE